MPAVRRNDSNTTHVSDSEPEREAARSRAPSRASPTSTSSRCRQVHRRAHTPFTDRSNTQGGPEATLNGLYFGVEARLMHLESEISQLRTVLKELFHPPSLAIPSAQDQRRMVDKCKLNEQYDKSFDFPKQHGLYHSTPDIRNKGPHFIYCTRVNEGFHQETREIYARLNKRNVDEQMTELDAIREAMARIRMTLNQYDANISERIAKLAEHTNVSPNDIREVKDASDENHWQLGSPQNLVNSRFAMKDTVWINDSTRRSFHSDLRSFIRNTFPDEPLREDGEEVIAIRPFQCIYIHYTSLEDWTDRCDVLRCNPSFQVNHEERFDCVAINMDDDPLTFGRMLFLFQCRLPSGRTEAIALVRLFKKSTWRPKTLWKNCRIYEDSRTIFILPRYFVRGAHMINCFGCSKEARTFYLDDVADSDWVLRAGN